MAENDITCPRVVLCEGANDAAFIKHLIANRQLPAFFITYPTHDSSTDPGGRDGFIQRLRALKLKRGFNQVTDLIVISDNDDDPTRKFALVRELIEAAEDFEVPLKAADMVGREPRVGIYMLPAPNIRGQLETLCLQSCVNRWPNIATCLDAYIACNPEFAVWEAGKIEKMKMRILLSSICSTDPNTSLTHAWSRPQEIAPLNHACFDALANFLASIPVPELNLRG